MKHLEYTFTIGSYDMDVWGNMKPTAILNICQEAAYMHSTKYGFGFDRLLEVGAAWVLSRASVEIERLPRWHDQITVRTWHKGQSGIFSLRDYIFYDSQQQPIIRVTTSWLIINIASRRILRATTLFGNDDTYTHLAADEHALASEASRVVISAEDIVSLGTHTVLYSDLDVNRHVNNTRYLEWACDHAPQQMKEGAHLRSFTINFNHEARYGEYVELAGVNHGCDMSIEGSANGHSVFAVDLHY